MGSSNLTHQPLAAPAPRRKVRARTSVRALEQDIDALLERVSRQEAAGDALEQALVALQSDLARVADAP